MAKFVYKNRVKEYAWSMGIRFSDKSFAEADKRVMDMIRIAAERAKKDKRKTILPRDLHHDPDLFDV